MPGIILQPQATGSSIDEKFLGLLHFNGADGGTTFTDDSGRPWVNVNSASTSTAWSKFGTASLKLAAGNARIKYNRASQDYPSHYFRCDAPTTIDFWFNTTDANANRWLFVSGGPPFYYNRCMLNPGGNNGKIQFNVYGGVDITSTHGGFNDGNSHHVAIVYDPWALNVNRRWLLFVDGVEEATGTSNWMVTQCQDIAIGDNWSGTDSPVCYIDEFAWRARAVWTADFVPPTTPYVWS